MRKTLNPLLAALALMVIASALVLSLGVSRANAADYYAEAVWPESVRSLWVPKDVARSPLDGMVFVADSQAGRVAIYDSAGAYLGQFDGREAPPGQELVLPEAVTVGPDANVYVADFGADRISVFTREGVFIRSWGVRGSGTGQLLGPSALAFDPAGLLFVSDQMNDRIQVFSATGVHQRTIGVSGYANGQLRGPDGLSIHAGELYVADTLNKRVQVFSIAGVYLRQWGWVAGSASAPTYSRYGAPGGVLAGAWGVYVSDAGRPIEPAPDRASVIETCTSAGVLRGTYGGLGSATGQLDQPAGMARDASGTLLVADSNNHRVARFDTSAASWLPPWFYDGSTEAEELADPHHVALDPDGSVWVADTRNARVQHYSASGEFLGTMPASVALSEPWGVAVSADGATFAVTEVGADRVSVFGADGTLLARFGMLGTTDGRFRDPASVAWTPSGDLLVADTGNSRLQWFGADGTHKRTAGSFGSSLGQFDAPAGVSVDASGTVYVADTGNNRIQVLEQDGAPRRSIGGLGSGPGAFRSPTDVRVDPQSGRLVVADTNNFRVQILEDDGTHVRTIGARGASPGEFRAPFGLAMTGGGGIFVSDVGHDRVQRFVWDADAPVTSISGVPATWVNAPATVTLTAADGGSGVYGTYYRLNGGPEQMYSGPFTVSAAGETIVQAWSVDRAGNSENAKSAAVRIDLTPPSGTMSAVAPTARRSVSFEIASAVADATTMRVNAGGGWTGRTAYAATSSVTVPGEGHHTITAQYFDSVDNTLTLTAQVLSDLSPPTVTLSGAPASGVATGPVTIAVTATDAYTAVAGSYVSVDGQPERLLVGSVVTVSGDGAHSVRVRAVDSVGNWSGFSESTFSIDATPPSGSMVVLGGAEVVGTDWVTVSNSVSGAVQMRYDLGLGWGAWRADARFYEGQGAGEGTRTIRAQFKDAAGNVLELSRVIQVDFTPPNVTAIGVPESGIATGAVSVTLEASDSPAGVETVLYSIGAGADETYVKPVVFDAPGHHELTYRALDSVGNESEPVTIGFDIVDIAPEGMATLAGGASAVATRTVALHVEAAPAATMRVDVDGAPGEFSPFTGDSSVTFAGDGLRTVSVLVRSRYGAATVLSDSVIVDTQGPSVTVGGLPAETVADTVTVTLDAVDQLSDVSELVYDLDGQGEAPYEGPVSASSDGTHTLTYRATDSLGNQTTGEARFRIHTRAPEGVMVVASGASIVGTLTVPVRFEVTDAATVRIDGGSGYGPWRAYASETTASLAGEGVNVVRAELRSEGGRTRILEQEIAVDLTGPVSDMVAGRVTRLRRLSSAAWAHDVALTWRTRDLGPAPSGVAGHRYRVNGSVPAAADTPQLALSGLRGSTDVMVSGIDVVGNPGVWRSYSLGLGSVSAPVVPKSARSGLVFAAVARNVPSRHGSTYTLCWYLRQPDGTFRLERRVPMRVTGDGASVDLKASSRLSRGVWVGAIERSSGDSLDLGRPSSAITVR